MLRALRFRRLSFIALFCLIIQMVVGPAGSSLPAPVPPGAPGYTPTNVFRTHITVPDQSTWLELQRLGMVVLSAQGNTATVIVDAGQLQAIVARHIETDQSDDLGSLLAQPAVAATPLRALLAPFTGRAYAAELPLAGATLVSRVATMSRAEQLQLATLNSVGSIDDGLTDTQNAWWCINAQDAYTSSDQYTSGQRVGFILQYLHHPEQGDHRQGPPFKGWPMATAGSGCTDADQDSIPDDAERFVLGTDPNKASTSGDKYADGQKVFNEVYCPGGQNSCGYGPLPRSQDPAFVSASLPDFVQWPARSPWVAAEPKIEINAVPGSFNVQAAETITSSSGGVATTGESKTYGTSVTKGTSDAVANTKTWNNWQSIASTQAASFGTLDSFNIFDPTTLADSLQVIGNGLKSVSVCGGAVLGVASGVGAIAGIGLAAGCVKTLPDFVTSVGKFGTDTACNGQPCTTPDQVTSAASVNKCSPKCVTSVANPESSAANAQLGSSVANGNGGFQGVGTQYGQNSSGAYGNRLAVDVSIPFQPTTTRTTGQSQGGSLTTTHTELNEYTTSQSSTQQFAKSATWDSATATDTAHAADLTFQYSIANTGTDYATEVNNVTFNIQIGSGSTALNLPSYFASQQDIGPLYNVVPGALPQVYTSKPVPLTLDEMKAIDNGAPITISLADVSYGSDQTFYQAALAAGVDVTVATVQPDGVSERFVQYVLPVFNNDTLQMTLCRYFPCHSTAPAT